VIPADESSGWVAKRRYSRPEISEMIIQAISARCRASLCARR
jgi:hypothetical protein